MMMNDSRNEFSIKDASSLPTHKSLLVTNYRLNNGNCTFEAISSESTIVKVAVDVFYLFGGFLSIFGIVLNILCIQVVRKSKMYSKTCYGLYLRFICFTDVLKLLFEYQFRIVVFIFNSYLHAENYAKSLSRANELLNQTLSGSVLANSTRLSLQTYNSDYSFKYFLMKVLHCNLRLGFIMITENLSYIYCIYLAADRCFRIWDTHWAKNHLTFSFIKKLLYFTVFGVFIYCIPHFFPVRQCVYINYPPGYLTKFHFSDCKVSSSSDEGYFSFEFYWLNIESVVNTYVLPFILVSLNMFLAFFIIIQFNQNKTPTYSACCSGGSSSQATSSRKSSEATCRVKLAKRAGGGGTSTHTKLVRRKRELIKATKEASFLVLGDTLLFVIVITPVNAFTYFFADYDEKTRNVKTAFQLMGLTFSLINHSFNGVVYLICSKTFRIEFKRILGSYCTKGLESPKNALGSGGGTTTGKRKSVFNFDYFNSRLSKSVVVDETRADPHFAETSHRAGYYRVPLTARKYRSKSLAVTLKLEPRCRDESKVRGSYPRAVNGQPRS